MVCLARRSGTQWGRAPGNLSIRAVGLYGVNAAIESTEEKIVISGNSLTIPQFHSLVRPLPLSALLLPELKH